MDEPRANGETGLQDPQLKARIEELARQDIRREAKQMLESPLSLKQETFVKVYVDSGGSLEQAWTTAGYSKAGKNWKREAQRLVGNPKVYRRIAALQHQTRLGENVDIDWVKMKAAQVVNRCIQLNNYKDALAGLRLLAEHLRMLPNPEGNRAGAIANLNVLGLLTGDDKEDEKRLRKAASIVDVEVKDAV